MPTLYVVAGPNGCGKSTLTRTSRFVGVVLIDPDAIARDVSPNSPGRAAREALRRRFNALHSGSPHIVETILAGSGILQHMRRARTAGYRIDLHFVSLDSADQALYRIRNRVALGGHDVPEEDVRRRFSRSLDNLPAAIFLSDEVRFYDNTDHAHPYREVASFAQGNWWTARRLPDWTKTALAHAEWYRIHSPE